ncbi:hypothetical protein BIV08_20640 [Pseudomonas sp. AF76]|nr:hypothetical protein BIV09_24340 [Pseudomonas sp. 7SR1]ROO37368.1 hypothetical protein BIV08_20640 [Pseudomonas sp. AF76]
MIGINVSPRSNAPNRTQDDFALRRHSNRPAIASSKQVEPTNERDIGHSGLAPALADQPAGIF